jgi:uncharacterized BrkB/YihY/UPF0761 family membrane protein
MNPAEQVLRRVDRYQQQHPWVGVPFAVVKKFGDDKGGNLTTLLAYNGFFALLPLLLVLVTLLGYLLGHHPTLEQQVLRSALAEFPILGTQLEQNIHALRANGIGLAIGIAGSLWGARGVTQAGQHAMAELWNIPGKDRPSFWTRQARGLALPTRQLVAGAIVGGVAWQALLAAGGYLVGHNLKHASEVYGFFAVVLGLLSWLYLGAQLTLYAAEVNVVRARRLWPRSLLQPPLTQPDQRALVDLAKQEERRPEQSVEVTFTPEPESGQPNGPKHPKREP